MSNDPHDKTERPEALHDDDQALPPDEEPGQREREDRQDPMGPGAIPSPD